MGLRKSFYKHFLDKLLETGGFTLPVSCYIEGLNIVVGDELTNIGCGGAFRGYDQIRLVHLDAKLGSKLASALHLPAQIKDDGAIRVSDIQSRPRWIRGLEGFLHIIARRDHPILRLSA